MQSLKGKGHDGMTMAGSSGPPEDERASLVVPGPAALALGLSSS